MVDMGGRAGLGGDDELNHEPTKVDSPVCCVTQMSGELLNILNRSSGKNT